MLYESITYESILARMLSRVEEWAHRRGINIDTREGSLIRTALAPAAVELKLMYIELDEILNESFADTASREFLIRRCAERGISVVQATKAIRQGEFNLDVEIGSRFSLNQLNYRVIERISKHEFKLECETPGNVGNYESGALIPVDYIHGLEKALLTKVIVPGDDEEATEHLRRRYFDNLSSQAFGGNIADYKEKVNRLPGVGGCKVYPVWNGGGTVKVVFLNSDFEKPNDDHVDIIQTVLDPTRNKGVGLGLAPIGHDVTVEAVNEADIDIKMCITFQDGWHWNAAKPYVEAAIDQYFKELSMEWDKADWESALKGTVIWRFQIEARVRALAGIFNVQDTALNGIAGDLTLDPYSIPKRRAIVNV